VVHSVVDNSIIFTLTLQVKNKMPAPVQITAEQLLREAKERELELVQPVVLNAFRTVVADL